MRFTLGIVAATLLVAGCEKRYILYRPDAGAGAGGDGGSGGTIPPPPDAGEGGGTGCDGFCAPGQALGWDYAALVWFGPEQDAPECPPGAPSLGFEGYADLDAPHDCGTCTCSASTGSCGLPTTMTANAASCAQNGSSTPHTPFDPQAGWAGACDTNLSIPSGKLCGGAKCVQSLTIGPLSVSEGSCTPSEPPPPPPLPTWKSFARACRRVPYEPCLGSTGVCTANPPPGSGFRVCVLKYGDHDCPGFSPYSEKHLSYLTYEDTRACAPCTCGAPSGGACASTVSVFSDGACSSPLYTTPVTSSGPTCTNVSPTGAALGSKSATTPTYTPGKCEPAGGGPIGAATPQTPVTQCCLPEP